MKYLKAIGLVIAVNFFFQACSCDEGNGEADFDVEEEEVDDVVEVDQETLDGIDGVDGDDVADVPIEDIIEEEVTAECGNGTLEGGEECDDGEGNSDTEPNACRESCVLPYCGDGVVDAGEGCDDGNDIDDDECRNICALPSCGNGDVEFGEECDDSNDDDTDGCLSTCVFASCGDGHVHDGVEECDDRNHAPGDGCEEDCTFSCHGDGECDDGNVCTDDACAEGGTGRLCSNDNNTAECDDGDPCTDGDVCADGVCVPGEYICECTVDGDCEEFEDGNLCNGTYMCNDDNFCEIDPATIITCDTSGDTECSKNLCDPDTGECSMTDLPMGTPCDDDDPCNNPDTCDGGGTCVGTTTGLTDCGGECVDLMTDHDHCGECFDPCAFDEDCVLGECRIHEWSDVGDGGLAAPGDNVLAQAISTDAVDPFVAMIFDSSTTTKPVEVHRYEAGAWSREAGLDSEAEGASPNTIDLDFNGSRPNMVFPHRVAAIEPPFNIRIVRCESDLTTCNDEFYMTTCMMNFSVKMDLEGADAHFTTLGAGGCGIGVGYAWYDASDDVFYEHPGTTLGYGLLPWEGNGKPGIVVTDRPYVGVLGMDFMVDPPNLIYVAYWDSLVSAWQPLDGDLAVHDGECMGGGSPGDNPCAIDLAADAAGVLYAAWTENRDPNTRLVYVRRHDEGAWTLLGGPLNDLPDGGFGNGANPVIHVARGEVFVAYQDFAGTNYRIFVKHWNGTSWDRVGPPLNIDTAAAAVEPDITSLGSDVYVSFREAVGGGVYNVFVKSFP